MISFGCCRNLLWFKGCNQVKCLPQMPLQRCAHVHLNRKLLILFQILYTSLLYQGVDISTQAGKFWPQMHCAKYYAWCKWVHLCKQPLVIECLFPVHCQCPFNLAACNVRSNVHVQDWHCSALQVCILYEWDKKLATSPGSPPHKWNDCVWPLKSDFPVTPTNRSMAYYLSDRCSKWMHNESIFNFSTFDWPELWLHNTNTHCAMCRNATIFYVKSG